MPSEAPCQPHTNHKLTHYKQRITEKVNRFKFSFPDEVINEFYSDSKSDFPLADIAMKAYFVKGDYIKEWNTNSK